MKVEIKEQKKNPLLKRNEAVLTIDHQGTATPSRAQILEAASNSLKVDKSLVIVDSIFTESGMSKSNVRILVYPKKGDIPEYKLQKMQPKKKKKQSEPEAEAPEKPAEEKPVEEKKPEPKAEEKKEDKPEEKPKEEKEDKSEKKKD